MDTRRLWLMAGLMAVTVGCASRVARGLPIENWGQADQREADQAAEGWRAGGAAGLAGAAQTFCQPNLSQPMRKAAEATLKAAGLDAIPGLVACLRPLPGRFRSADTRLVTLTAQILCSASPDDLGRLESAMRSLPRVERPKQASFAERVLLAAIGGELTREPFECAAKDELVRHLVAEVLPPNQLASLNGDRRHQVLRSLTRVGPSGAPTLPVLVDWLSHDDEENSTKVWVADALASMGSAARGATPAILQALDRYAANPRNPREKTLSIDTRSDVLAKLIAALTAVAAPSAEIASRLVAILQRNLKEQGLSSGSELLAVVRALPRLSAGVAPNPMAKILPDLEALLRFRVTGEASFPIDSPAIPCFAYHGDSCPPEPKPRPGRWPDSEPLPRRRPHPLNSLTWQALVDAISDMGAPARPLAPWLSRLMLDDAVDLGLRMAAAQALLGMGDDTGNRELRDALIRRRQALAQLPIRLDRREFTQSLNQRQREAPHFAAEALGLCLADQGAPAPAIEAQLMGFADLANQRFDLCLDRRLCGPTPKDRASALRICCDYAYVGKQPPLCQANAAGSY